MTFSLSLSCRCPIGFYGDQCEIGGEPTSVARAEGLGIVFA